MLACEQPTLSISENAMSLCAELILDWQDFADITERWPGGEQLPTHHGQIDSGCFLTTRKGTKNVGITGPGIIDGGAARELSLTFLAKAS